MLQRKPWQRGINVKSNPYDSDFFDSLIQSSSSSATFIAQYIYNSFKPRTVIDVGCGTGEILKVLSCLGEIECLGVEGPWIDKYQERYDKILFADLSEFIPLRKKYDLAICLEVAEHLEERFASTLISTLTAASDVIMFSAAIPGQGGTEHVNLKYPDYWAKHFWEHGFALYLDPRKEFLRTFDIAPWYQQNTLVFRKIGECWTTDHIIIPETMRHPSIFSKEMPLRSLIYRTRRRIHLVFNKTNNRGI